MSSVAYERVTEEILAKLEDLAKVKAPSSAYLAALEDAREQVDAWFEASIMAAKDDVARTEG